MKVLDLRAVAIGVAVDVAGSVVLGLAGSFVMTLKLTAAGVAMEDVFTELASVGHNPVYTAFVLIVGFGMTVVGGYVAARLAKQSPVVNAAFVGAASVILGVLMGQANIPMWYQAMAILLPIPSALAGGWIFTLTRTL